MKKHWQIIYHVISKATLRTWIVLGILALSLSLFLEISEELHEAVTEGDPELDLFDRSILNFLFRLRNPGLNSSMVDITALGSGTVLTLLVIAFVVLMWMLKDRFAAIYMAVAGIGSSLLTTGLKLIFGRERPTVVEKLVEVNGFSYPSGHSLASAAIYLSFAILACRYFRTWPERAVIFLMAALLVGSIAISRVYLGVHYATDVAAGMSLGVAWAFLLGGFEPTVARWWDEQFSKTRKKTA